MFTAVSAGHAIGKTQKNDFLTKILHFLPWKSKGKAKNQTGQLVGTY